MPTPLFGSGYAAASYCGVLSLVVLWAFSSLVFELELGLQSTKQTSNTRAQAVLETTADINFVGVLVSFGLIGYFGLQVIQVRPDWPQYFLGSIGVTWTYWVYAKACEQKLKSFLAAANQPSQLKASE